MSTISPGQGAASPPFAATPQQFAPGTGPAGAPLGGVPAFQGYPPGAAPYMQSPGAAAPFDGTVPGAWAWAAPNAAVAAPNHLTAPYAMSPVPGQPPGLAPPGVPPPGVAPGTAPWQVQGVPAQGVPQGAPGSGYPSAPPQPVYEPAPGDPGWRPSRTDLAPATQWDAPSTPVQAPPVGYPPQGYQPGAFPGQPAQPQPPAAWGASQEQIQPQTTLAAAPFDPHEVAQARAKAQAFDQMAPQVQKYEQAFEALQDLAQKAQAKQAEIEMQQGRQGRVDQYYQMAAMMAPEDGYTYLRKMEDIERQQADQTVRQAVEMGQQRMMEAVTSVAGPLFAQDLVRENGLPPEYAQRLASLHPRDMETYVPLLQREYAEKQQTQAQLQWMAGQLDQMNRAQQATWYAASGAHTVGTGYTVPAAGLAMPFEPGSREHLLSIPGVAQMLFG